LVWERYDVVIRVQGNGDMEVEETQEITFTGGTFTFGYRAIPLDRVEEITDVQVYELLGDRLTPYDRATNQREYTFRTYVEGGEQVIRWYFPKTRLSTHTYVIRYRVKGGLRIYEEGDQVWWKAIGADHNFPIHSSQVRVELPAPFNPQDFVTAAYGTEATSYAANGSTVLFTAQNIKPGDELEVRVQFPHGVVRAQPPAWQAEDDRRRALQEKYGPIFDLSFLVLGLLILFGGPVGVYVLWYLRGRDEPAGIVAETISEPPSDLPPGAAGTLVDEQADMEDILATLIDLARRGALTIEEKYETGFLGLGSGWEFTFHLKNKDVATRPYEKTLLRRIFRSGKRTTLSALRNKFYRDVPKLQKQLYDDVVRAGFFVSNPQTTRRVYMTLGVAALVLSIVLGMGLLIATADYSGMAICPTVGMIITSIALIIVGRHMPKKTRRGAEEAAKWMAFKRYLESLEKYGNLEAARERFEQFLPYAVAFGIERSFLRQLATANVPAP
ncbi:MAG: DUF2207 domain-containing protein, partial [Caldilineae bacterium]